MTESEHFYVFSFRILYFSLDELFSSFSASIFFNLKMDIMIVPFIIGLF